MKAQSDSAQKGRRPYQKPELTQVSLRPEEAVLGKCKIAGTAGPGQPACNVPGNCQGLGS